MIKLWQRIYPEYSTEIISLLLLSELNSESEARYQDGQNSCHGISSWVA
ncbi:hypothetical protein FOCG_02738 [Fusarium oxysporum f. sp. radicis-lycopersici 26381]|nr:hypothetical protein FOCG_02738 [Fusarium oxysporum f. sp. radicis-lycopersici 26381]